ncbi:MAG: WG repeat-containing protein [Bacteroidales bacterium]|nr:WG repeat-containing protein [Bacteroidales bacterium]
MRNILIVLGLILFTLVSCTNKENEAPSTLYRIMVGDKYGFINEHGKIVIEPQFDYAGDYFSEGVCYAQLGEQKGLIDSTGNFIVELDSFEYIPQFIKGLAVISNNKIITTDGGIIINLPQDYGLSIRTDEVYDNVYVYGVKHYEVITNGSCFIANRKGDFIGTYKETGHFMNGLCPITYDDKWGYIDTSGNLVIDTIYDGAEDFSKEGIARVQNGEGEFFIDKHGNHLFSVDKILTDFSSNRAFVVLKGDTCLIDKTGKKICVINADRVYPFDNGNLSTIIKNGKAVKIDTMGNIVLQTDYEYIGEFINGVAPAYKNDKMGYIDTLGKEIINVKYAQSELANFYGKEYIHFLKEEFHQEKFKLRAVHSYKNGKKVRSYYDLQGNLIWKDIPNEKIDFLSGFYLDQEYAIKYFDSRLSELDPIEGIYYVTIKNYYQDRDNPNIIGLNGSESHFFAVVKEPKNSGFKAWLINSMYGSMLHKFEKLGESNQYAIISVENDEYVQITEEQKKSFSESLMILEDPTHFEYRLEKGHNYSYNFFTIFEYIRDYPSAAVYEKIQKAEWTGTGFAIADGYIATNYHVTSGAKTIHVKGINGNMKESYKGYVVASDKEHDISIIKIVDKKFEDFGSIPYNINQSPIDVGDDIFVLGYPMTETMGEEIKLTKGIISAKSGYKGSDDMYQISAAVQPGNSGSPLFNSDGTIIGIINATHGNAENANYAIKISYLNSLVHSSNLGIEINKNNKIHARRLSKKVKKIKNYVYLIECSSR